jgi:signal transduction histidine kinase
MEPATRQSLNSAATNALAAREWLQEAAACLADTSRPLPPPPHADLQAAYEAVVACRQRIEQMALHSMESLRMQSLHTVGSVLAHDLHNLALRLALLSQNLERFYGERGFLQSIQRVLDDTVERMNGLVDNFRERQDTIVIKIPTDVNDVLRTVVRQMRLSQLPGVALAEDFKSRTRIWADPFFLANAFQVLLENAVQAMPNGGRLNLRTRSGCPPSRSVQVEVEDTGVGMTREFIDRELFTPFRSGKSRGLGLGMFICQQIVKLHDAELSVESQPARGTCFRMTFPAGPETS